ncbi:condensation domain-containing protein [Streptomyces sp. NBC_00989]|uniref:condensation domain-containing protein n=1 Tax=Streptomyces sp. NBC_00989 TaxID=2903705 RepID=UPI00386DD103|nr:condensation domain-containing protein [Streptomyces sp. NBC_00989]WSW98010.1 condensation domain-containing protein [Streptomyces sp. NBC_00989]
MTANRFPNAPTVVVLGPGPGLPARTAPWDLDLRGPLDPAALHRLLDQTAPAGGQRPGSTGHHRLLRHAPDHHTLRCTATADTPAFAVAGRIADLLTAQAAYGHPLTPAQRALLTRAGAARGYRAMFLETAAGTDTETVRRALHTVVAAHPHLCLRLDTATGHLSGPPVPAGQDLLTEGRFTDESGFTEAVTALARTLDPPGGIHLRALLARDHRPSHPHTDRLTLLTHELTADTAAWQTLLTDLTSALGPTAIAGPAAVPSPATVPGPAAGLSPATVSGSAGVSGSAEAVGSAAVLSSATAPDPAVGFSPAAVAGSAEAVGPAEDSSSAKVPGPAEVPGSATASSSAADPATILGSADFPSAAAPGAATVLPSAAVRTAVRAQCAGDGVADWVAGLRELARDPAEARHWSLIAERRSRPAASRPVAGRPRPSWTADATAPPGTAPLPASGTLTPGAGPGVAPDTTPAITPGTASETGPDTAAPLPTPETGPDPALPPAPETGPGTASGPAPLPTPDPTPETPPPPAPDPVQRTAFALDEERTERITQHLARRLALTAEQVLTGVFALALARWQHTDEVGFDVCSDPRSGHPGLRRHVGRLTDVHPVQLTLDPGPDALGQLAAAAGFLAAGAGRAAGGAGFGACREFSPDPLLRATLRELPPAPACLILHAPDEAPPAPAHPVPGIPEHRTHRLHAHARITAGRLHLTLDQLPDRPTTPAPVTPGPTTPSAFDGLPGSPGTDDLTTPSVSAGAAESPASAAPVTTGRATPSATDGLPDAPDTDDLTTPSVTTGVTETSTSTALTGPPATPALPAPETPPTPTSTPTPTTLAPLLRDVLEELADAATAPVPAAFAPTAQQVALYTGGDAQPGTGRHVEQLVWVWHGPLDTERFGAAWQSVFDCEAVLRTAFTGTSPPQLIVHGRVTPDITHRIPSGGDWAPFLERDRLRGFDLRCPGALRLTLLEPEQAPPATAGTPTRIVLTYHRALLDTWSAHLLLRTFYRAYLAGGTLPGGERRPDLRDYTAWIAAQDPRPARALWARFTPPGAAAAASRPGRPGEATGLSGVGRARLRLDPAETVRLARWAGTWGTAESSVLQAVWAMLIYRASGATGPAPVCFAVTVPGRGIALDGAAWLPGPLRNLLPMSIEVDPADTVPRLLRHLRDRALDMAAYEWLPADPPPTPAPTHPQAPQARAHAGADADRAETVLVFEDPPHPVHGLENELAAHGIRAEFPGTVPARSVLPLALLAHHDSTGGLILTGVHDRALLDEAAAAELLVQSALLLRELPLGADESTTVAQVLKLLEGRAVPPMADDTPKADTPTTGPTTDRPGPTTDRPAPTTDRPAPTTGLPAPITGLPGPITGLPGPTTVTGSATGPIGPTTGPADPPGPPAAPDPATTPAPDPAADPVGPGTPLTLLRAARHQQAGTICLVPPPGAPPTCYDLLPPAYPGPQELLLLNTSANPDAGSASAALAARTAGRPLLLAGFSGAGAVACDLARRLAVAGRRPPRVVLTPAPPGERERARVLARALQNATAPPP